MTSVELSPLTRKLSAFVAGRDMVHQGQTAQAAYILSAGWVCS